MAISLYHIDKSFGGQAVLRDVSFTFPQGAVTALTGPSGSGKTTLLNILLGLIEPDAGSVSGIENRRVGVVFQEDRLIEHMTALGNVKLACLRGMDAARAERILAAVGLDPGDGRRVSEYSGGMRRRVAIARALVIAPDALFLDEPFKGLDEKSRGAAIAAIRRYAEGATVVLISHDREEAALMGAGEELRLEEIEARTVHE